MNPEGKHAGDCEWVLIWIFNTFAELTSGNSWRRKVTNSKMVEQGGIEPLYTSLLDTSCSVEMRVTGFC